MAEDPAPPDMTAPEHPLRWRMLAFLSVAMVWEASVVAYSAQFSTALTGLSNHDYRGTALGTAAMLRLQTLPEATAMALGRR